jgi:hypothetical protein
MIRTITINMEHSISRERGDAETEHQESAYTMMVPAVQIVAGYDPGTCHH